MNIVLNVRGWTIKKKNLMGRRRKITTKKLEGWHPSEYLSYRLVLIT